MKYVDAKGLRLSSFALGTVQLGMTYGLGEHKEKPTEDVKVQPPAQSSTDLNPLSTEAC